MTASKDSDMEVQSAEVRVQSQFSALCILHSALYRRPGRGNLRIGVGEVGLEVLDEHARQLRRLLIVGGLVGPRAARIRSEEHTSELQSQSNLVCRLLLEKKKKQNVENDVHM